MIPVVQCLPSKLEALNSNPSTYKKDEIREAYVLVNDFSHVKIARFST
jgi:hypothetical protein